MEGYTCRPMGYSLAGQARSHVQQNNVNRCDELKGSDAEQLQKGPT